MSDPPPPIRVFRAWARAAPPFDAAPGRARFVDAFHAKRKARSAWQPLGWVALSGAAACAAIACAAIVWWRTPAALRFTTATGAGEAGAWLATGPSAELPLVFSEGTRLVMEPDSRGRVEQLGGAGATFLLERGEVRARVVHRDATRWSFRAGPFEVRVTGTALAVEWDPGRDRFAVRVDEGSVVVDGPTLGAQQVVRAGERYAIDVPSRTMRLTRGEAVPDAGDDQDAGAGAVRTAPALDPPPPPVPRDAPRTRRAGPPSPSAPAQWVTLDGLGDDDDAYAAAQAEGIPWILASAAADDLVRLARVGRMSGHRDVERDALVACRDRYPGTEQAADAAYELGRASSAADAARWFATYLREKPAGPLAREALGRLVEAYLDAGDSAAAREAATRYLAAYPQGPRAALARRIVGGAPE